MDVFVSYASSDRERVAPMVEALEQEGWQVWWDRDINAGAAFDREIQLALDRAKCVLVVWTENSVESDWVRAEAGEGLERGTLLPIVLDEVKPPLVFRRIQSVARENLIQEVARRVLGAPTSPRVHLLTCLAVDTTGDLSQVQKIARRFRGRERASSRDTVCLDFPSATGAMRAALEIRSSLGSNVRISVHAGEEAPSGANDEPPLQTTGEALALRAEPASICISDPVYQEVRRRLELAPQTLGAVSISGVVEPVLAYLVRGVEVPRITVRADQQPVKLEEDVPTLAVLPFRNMNANPDFEYFGDGIAMDVVEELLRIPRLHVVSTMSTLTYKKSSATATDIGRDLGVKHVLEGSVRQVGNQMRITAQLVNTETGQLEWADHYDRSVEDVFSVQDDITQQISTELDVKFYSGEGARVTHQLIRSPEARQYFYRGWELANRLNKADLDQAKALLEQAIHLEPESPLTYSFLGWLNYLEMERGWVDSDEDAVNTIKRLTEEALNREDRSGIGPMLAGYLSVLDNDHDGALVKSKEAIELRPSCPVAFSMRAGILNYAGMSDEAVAPAKQAVRLSPVVQPVYPEMLSLAYYLNHQHTDALETANNTLSYAPDSVDTRVVLAATLVETGRTDVAGEIGAEILSLDPAFALQRYESSHPFRDKGTLERITSSLSRAGLEHQRDTAPRFGLAPESRRRVMPQRKR